MTNLRSIIKGFFKASLITGLLSGVFLVFIFILIGANGDNFLPLMFSVFVFIVPAVATILFIISLTWSIKYANNFGEKIGFSFFFALFPCALLVYYAIGFVNRLQDYSPRSFDNPIGTINKLVLEGSLSRYDDEGIMYLKSGFVKEILAGAEESLTLVGEATRAGWRYYESTSLKPWSECLDDLEGIAFAQRHGLFVDCISTKKHPRYSKIRNDAIFLIYKKRIGIDLLSLAALYADAQGQPSKEFFRWELDSKKIYDDKLKYKMLAAITGKPEINFPRKFPFGQRAASIIKALTDGAVLFPKDAFAFMYGIRNEFASSSVASLSSEETSQLDQISKDLCANGNLFDEGRISSIQNFSKAVMSRKDCTSIYEKVKLHYQKDLEMTERLNNRAGR